MTFSKETTDLIFDIMKFSNGLFKNTFELSVLIEHTISSDNPQLFSDIIFKAKYIKGLLKIIKDNPQKDDKTEKIHNEFSGNLIDLKEQILNLLQKIDDEIHNSFQTKYFEMNIDSLNNYYGLIDELAKCKDYFLDKNNQ